MQLDRTRIAIRERSYVDILDLALRVVRAYPLPMAVAFALGAAPMILINNWLLGALGMLDVEFEFNTPTQYLFWCAMLIILEIPLAAAPCTLFLGQAMFVDKIDAKQLLKDFRRSLPQLLIFQVLLRGLLLLPIATLFVIYTIWPYLNEIILLERNPLFAGEADTITTRRRSSAMHSHSLADLFSRWLAAMAVGCILIAGMAASIWWLRGLMTNNWSFDAWFYTIHLQAVVWFVIGFFSVVRFLSYVDLRIRLEGWEVELLMRAEAAHLTRRIA